MIRPWEYSTKQQAEEVLDYYENFILRSPYIIYIAIVELDDKLGSSFKLDIGLNSKGFDPKTGKAKIDIDEDLRAIDVLFGNFPSNVLPAIFPVPSEFTLEQSECRCGRKETRIEPFSSLPKLKSVPVELDFKFFDIDEGDLISDNAKNRINKRSSLPYKNVRDWLNQYQYGGLTVYSDYARSTGTLGGIFELVGYPDKIFGITNWHIFGNWESFLGESVFSSDDKEIEIGNLFWKCKDLNREAAIIMLNSETATAIREKPFYHNNWRLGIAESQMKVKHFGYGTHEDSTGFKESKIYSTNATIKLRCGSTGRCIFKNQLLIKNYTVNGDSGSLVISNECRPDAVVGLNFSKLSVYKPFKTNDNSVTYSIANNINHILNYTFPLKQIVWEENGMIFRNNNNVQLINKFTLINYKLSKK